MPVEMVHFVPPRERRQILLAAQSDPTPVLITGANGTGKGALARWIHQNSIRKTKPLIEWDPNHALVDQIQKAQGGILQISEISRLPLGEQSLLHRFFTQRSVPHPENRKLKMIVNTRIFANSSQDLQARVQAGLFSAELLQAFSTYWIAMPNLSERTEELESIANVLVQEIRRELQKASVQGLTPETIQVLQAYTWPGNLRELRNVLRVAITRTQDSWVKVSDLPNLNQEKEDFQANREEFEKIYLTELLHTFSYDLKKLAQATQISEALLEAKLKKLGIPTQNA